MNFDLMHYFSKEARDQRAELGRRYKQAVDALVPLVREKMATKGLAGRFYAADERFVKKVAKVAIATAADINAREKHTSKAEAQADVVAVVLRNAADYAAAGRKLMLSQAFDATPMTEAGFSALPRIPQPPSQETRRFSPRMF